MGKKIVVITGSPRRNGNSFAMTRAFIEAAEAAGHSVTRFDAAFHELSGCRACDTCYRSGRPCSIDDDFNAVAPAILEADALLFSMPLYWYSMPAQIKSVIDRMYAFGAGGKDVSGKRCGLIACCADSGAEALDGIRVPYERIAALNGWENVGEVLVPGVNRPGDVNATDGCRRAAALAAAF
ncbi:MAG: flavodoxin family protein [Clostridia bacterium]|nr:flavodoxin family protein [Clostridia bacterium]